MSQKYPYTIKGDDFPSHQDMYADSYQRPSSTYQPGVRSSSQEQTFSTASSNRTADSSVPLPGMALSFLHSCGLDPSDLADLAELPEHLITIETLPQLLLEVKERKLSRASSTRPSTSQPLDDTSADAWESSSQTSLIKYPIDCPDQPLYPLPPEQVQTWQDRWGNPRRTNTLITGCSSSKHSSVPDYSVSMDSDPYCDTPKSPPPSSHMFVDYKPRPLLSLKLEPPVVVPTRKEALDFIGKIPGEFPHVCRLCDITIHTTKDWFAHVRSSEHANRQFELVKKYPKWDHTVESARKEISKVHKAPTRKEASDFIGIVPPVFPYLCVLCNTTVFSENDWSAHVAGGQHAQRQLDLMAKYPVWDGTICSSRRNDGHTSADRDGTSKGNTSDLMTSQAKDELRSRVVSFTPLPVGEGITSELTTIARRFGSVRKSLFLQNKGFVEMKCLAESRKLVEHYSANQLKLKGKLIQIAYSCEYHSLREAKGNDKLHSWGSRTLRSSSSPRRRLSSDRTRSTPKRKSLSNKTLSIPKRKPLLNKTLSIPKRRQLSDKTSSSSKRRRLSDRTQSSPKRRHSSDRTHSSPKRKGSTERTQSSPKRRHSSDRTHSSPKRKCSTERTHSSPKRKRSSDGTHSSPKRRPSSEKTHSSRSNHVKDQNDLQDSEQNDLQDSEQNDLQDSEQNDGASSISCHSSSSAAKAETANSSADTEEKSVSSNDGESMDSDSDLEGLEVIADDGEELAHDIDGFELATSEEENLPSEPMDVTDLHAIEEVNTGDNSLNDVPSEASNGLTEGRKFEDQEDLEIKEEDHDIPNILEHCVTLDEFTAENFSDCQESNEARPSIPQAEDLSDEVIASTNPMKQSDKEPEAPREESLSKTAAEPNTSENLEDTVVQPKEEHETERATGDLKESFGKILEVKNLPNAEDFTDLDFLNVLNRYGDVTRHVLFQSRKKGFVEMARASDAEEVAAESKNLNIALRGNVLKIKVSEKCCHLPEDGLNVGSDSDDDEIKEEDASKESSNTPKNDAVNCNTDSANEAVEMDEPVGTEFVRPVVGYFCNLCNVIYASEEEAKDGHCRSPSHREKVKDHKDKSGSVTK